MRIYSVHDYSVDYKKCAPELYPKKTASRTTTTATHRLAFLARNRIQSWISDRTLLVFPAFISLKVSSQVVDDEQYS